LLLPYYICFFFIFCYKTERKAIAEAEYGLDKQKTTLALLRLKVNCGRRKMPASFFFSRKLSISLMKQVNCAEQIEVKKSAGIS
jgi:hypothetical protein